MPIENCAIVAVVIAAMWFVGTTPCDWHPKSRLFKSVAAIGMVAAIAAFGITSWAEINAPTVPNPATAQTQAWVYRGHTRYVTVAYYRLIQGAMGVFFGTWGIGFAVGI